MGIRLQNLTFFDLTLLRLNENENTSIMNMDEAQHKTQEKVEEICNMEDAKVLGKGLLSLYIVSNFYGMSGERGNKGWWITLLGNGEGGIVTMSALGGAIISDFAHDFADFWRRRGSEMKSRARNTVPGGN